MKVTTIAGGLKWIAEGLGIVPEHEPVVPFAPEALVSRLEPKPMLGRIVRREPIWEGYFHLHALRSDDGRLLGIDWRKGPQPGAEPSALDPRTAIVAAITSVDGQLCSIFGESSPRLCNLLRGRPYVQYSPPGGRVDKIVHDEAGHPLSELETGVRIGLTEVKEETGGEIVPGLHRALSDGWTPTCAALTSEADRPVGAFVVLPADATSIGDGGKMEITHVKPAAFALATHALALARAGRINEASRWEPYVREFLEGMGYYVELGDFVQKESKQAVRNTLAELDRPSAPERERPARPTSAVIERVDHQERIDERHTIFSLTVDHAFVQPDGTIEKMGQPHPNIILHTSYDLAKVAEFYLDEVAGPMVRLREAERPALADPDGDSPRAPVLRDVRELAIDLPFTGTTVEELIAEASRMDFSAIAGEQIAARVPGEIIQLGAPDVATAGQSDTQFHFFAAKIDPPSNKDGFVPLSRAVELCRESEAATKAVLYRLADHLGWFCAKNMSLSSYAKQAKLDRQQMPKLI